MPKPRFCANRVLFSYMSSPGASGEASITRTCAAEVLLTTAWQPESRSAPPPATSNINESDVDDAAFHQNVKDVFFDYDSSEVNAPSQSVVTADASWLNQHPNLKIVLGGYCDERGSTEYNLALGESRAGATKQALIAAGIPADRIRTVSYGKEKQFCAEHDESCFQQNRRAQFSVDR